MKRGMICLGMLFTINYTHGMSSLFKKCLNYKLVKMARNNKVENLRKLLEKKSVDINWQHPLTQRTALIEAALCGHLGIAKILLEYGADPDKQDREGTTALMWACCANNTDLIRFLLVAKADHRITDNYGNTAANFAHDHDKNTRHAVTNPEEYMCKHTEEFYAAYKWYNEQ